MSRFVVGNSARHELRCRLRLRSAATWPVSECTCACSRFRWLLTHRSLTHPAGQLTLDVMAVVAAAVPAATAITRTTIAVAHLNFVRIFFLRSAADNAYRFLPPIGDREALSCGLAHDLGQRLA